MLVMAIQESKRIERQLQGRAGRQGDPGETRTIVGTDDPLIASTGLDVGTNLVQPLLTSAPSPITQLTGWALICTAPSLPLRGPNQPSASMVHKLRQGCLAAGTLKAGLLKFRKRLLFRQSPRPEDGPYQCIRGRGNVLMYASVQSMMP